MRAAEQYVVELLVDHLTFKPHAQLAGHHLKLLGTQTPAARGTHQKNVGSVQRRPQCQLVSSCVLTRNASSLLGCPLTRIFTRMASSAPTCAARVMPQCIHQHCKECLLS